VNEDERSGVERGRRKGEGEGEGRTRAMKALSTVLKMERGDH
jgi:hypothetical protein